MAGATKMAGATGKLRVELRGGVMSVVLARPDKRNAFDGEMLGALNGALEWADEGEGVRVVVLRSEGDVFCAGADLRWMAARAAAGPEANLESARRMGGVFHRISGCKRPVVVRVQGATMGGGVGLASACDLLVASSRAFFALSEVRLGLVPAVISPFVTRRVGPTRARALFLLGSRIGARDALRIGLCDRVVPVEELDAEVDRVVAELLRGAPGAQTLCKELVDGIAFRAPAEVLDFTARLISEQRATPEAAEGIAAFLGKRPPSWVPGEGRA